MIVTLTRDAAVTTPAPSAAVTTPAPSAAVTTPAPSAAVTTPAPSAAVTTVTSWVQPSPLGPLSITGGPAGVRRVWFSTTGEETGRRDAVVADAFDAYFSGDVAALDGLPVDLAGRTEFSRAVLLALRAIGPTRLTTYGELAVAIGRPGAARAVGRAVGANPVPVVIACHRVLAAAGALGGYSGGLDIKRRLLAHEGWLLGAARIAGTQEAATARCALATKGWTS